MEKLLTAWKANKLETSLLVCWLLTVFSSFWSDALISFTVPLVGAIFPFRVFLPITALLYLIWTLRGNDHIWIDSTLLEKWVYGLIVILLLYGVASLPRAIDFAWTFRKLFNLCLDLCFFFLMLRLCRNERWFRCTLCAVGAAMALLCIMGVWEIFNGGIFDPAYNDYKRFEWFIAIYQFPVVASGNTNDYSAELLMCASVLLLSLMRHWRSCGKAARWVVALSFGVLYLLILASSARLVKLCFFLVLAGFALFLLVSDRKRLWIVLAALCLIGGIRFANQYRYIVPPVRSYIAEMQLYREQASKPAPIPSEAPEDPSVPTKPSEAPEDPSVPTKPSLQVGDPRVQTLDEQFYTTDAETGEKALRNEGSAGERAHLLLHALDCFVESHGLGIGLGNTETLAAQRVVVPRWAGNSQQSIHCFIARLIADCGIFALLPLCVIGVLLLKAVLKVLLSALRRGDRGNVAYCLLFLFVLLTYPIASTASSDSQDMIAMWIYLASVILLANTLAASQPASVSGPLNTQNPTTLRIE